MKSYRDIERRVTALEVKEQGPRKIVIVNVTYADDTHTLELTPEEVEARLAAAHEEAGPDGIVIRWGYVDMSAEEAD